MKKHFYHSVILTITSDTHLTVEEILAKVLEQYPNAGKSTIYRNVEELAEVGELQKIKGVGNKAYFERMKTPHAHLINTSTGTITDLPLPALPKNMLPAGFNVEHVDIRIYGTTS